MPHPLDREHILHITEEIEVIIAAHLLWLKQINQALHFDCAQFANVLDREAHFKSPFGQWYYGTGKLHLSEHRDFGSMGLIQKEMHEIAARLYMDCRQFGQFQEEDYDHCMSLALHLNAALRHLQMDILGELLATDPLTGCFGRRGMLDRLRGEQERSARTSRPCCLCMMDFDRFKRVNDELGHPAGDAVLRQGMRFILENLRKYDSLFRYGGEEFLLCLPDTPLQDALNIVERLRAGLETLPIRLPTGDAFHVTASFGVAELPPSRSVEEAISAADQALYRAKEAGRNRVELAVVMVGSLKHSGAGVDVDGDPSILANIDGS